MNGRRRKLQFSLRGLFVLMSVSCVLLGIHMHRVRTQVDAVAKLAELGVKGLAYQPDLIWSPKKDTWWPPDWLVKQLGWDHFWSINTCALGAGRINERVVDQLVRLPQIRRLNITGSCSADSIRLLATLPRLEMLYFELDAYFDDQAFDAVAKIKSLKSLTMTSYGKLQKEKLKEVRPDIELHFHYDYVP